MRGSWRVVLMGLVVVGLMGAGQPERGNAFAVAVPYHAERAGAGTLTLEILDPEDHVLGRMETRALVTGGEGSWRESVRPEREMGMEEMAWERLRWRFLYADGKAMEGTSPMAAVLRRPVVRVLGQSEYMAGSRAEVRVIVTDTSAEAIASGTVRVDLETDKGSRQLFTGRLNRRGAVEAKLEFPAGLTGSEKLRFRATTGLGEAEFTQAIRLQDKAQILLTSEKPIYQPGQTIHVRALALDRALHTATKDKPLLFELEDSKGNKVFKRGTATDGFGIAAAEFALADEVNLGTYHLRATMGDSNRAELALNVERYVLPKFKVAVEFDQKNGKVKRDFRPGEHVTGTVRANYFFGQAVGRAEVEVKAKAADVAMFEAATAKGKTDGDGVYRFDLKLPEFFAGRMGTGSNNGGAARALVEASVKDSAAHTETRGEAITVSQSALLINAVPEGGQLVPKLENQVFVLTSYPDGTPAAAQVSVRTADGGMQQVATDMSGVGVMRMIAGVGRQTLKFDADDRRGSRAAAEVNLDARSGEDQVLLRASKAVFKAGDRIALKVVSTRRSGAAYVDVVKAGQTLLTRDVDLQNGQAELTLTATPEMAGTLDLDAYVFGRDAQPVMDHRLVFVQPADELKIEVAADKGVYKPGDDARIRFHVTNAKGEGVSAALGVEVVDEAVFALAEKQPGFAKTFFYLEQEVMKPRYEIHSVDMGRVVDPCDGETCELAAKALFSATEMAAPARVNVEFGRQLPEGRREEFRGRYEQALATYVRTVVAKLRVGGGDMVADFDRVTVADAWGTRLRVTPVGWQQRGPVRMYLVRSAGPDGRFDDEDDLTVYVRETAKTEPRRSVGGRAAAGNAMEIEHDRGPANGMAEVTGSVTDATGAAIPQAAVSLREASGKVRNARSNRDGEFALSGVPVGRYRLTIAAMGFATWEQREIVLEARDRAVVAARLNVGAMTQTVEVSQGSVGEDSNASATVLTGKALDALGDDAMGFRGRGRAMGGFAMAAPMPMMAAAAQVKLPEMARMAKMRKAETGADAGAETHVRSYFPEALYINPEIVTDGRGNASISVPVADSITTWRMAMLASTQGGALGTGTGSLKVFQDFFVDLDMPLTLTQGDKVSIPVAVFNYAGKAGKVSLKLVEDPWYTLDDAPSKSLTVESNQPGAASFTVNANRIGRFKLMLKAHMEGSGKEAGRDDIVVREIEVVPNGKEQNAVFNGRLEKTAEHKIDFPAGAIADASAVLVRLYPGPLSQVIEGMDGVLRMPGGCFEQTSSSTYPNVLALEYMKRTKKLTPEVHAKAEGYIANGYQRLLTFEVPGGGFSWFGQTPANKILTAYGLMEFSDMAKVSDVDPRLIARTQEWLARQQQQDGSWKPDTYFINEGATNRFNTDTLRITAYLGWALANTGYQGPAVGRAKAYVESHSGGKVDAYTLAVIANFAVESKTDPDFTRRAMQALLDAKIEKGDQVYWTAAETGMYSSGESAAVETTGLAVQALLKWGEATETARKALVYITAKKLSGGNWGTTQATIMALKAMVLASDATAANTHGTVTVKIDGQVAQTLVLNADNNDLLQQFVFKREGVSSAVPVQLSFAGTGSLAYQVVGRYFTPWEQKGKDEALAIDVAYDRTTLAKDAIATATATIKSHLPGTAKMVMVDLGIPPGFELMTEDLQEMQEKTAGTATGRLEKFSLTATQAILYFNAVGAQQTVTVKFRLRAKYPIRAKNFQSRVYEYYNPGVGAIARPVQFAVTK